jgi:hypothetical protein
MAYGYIHLMDIVLKKYLYVRTRELTLDCFENISALIKVRGPTSSKLEI